MTYPSVKDEALNESFDVVVNYVNTVSDSWFSNMILIAIFFIGTMVMYKNDQDILESVSVASAITFIFASFFWLGGFIATQTISLVVGVMVISVVSLWLSKKSSR